ncbi:YcxB family protein [Anaeromicrobium sediminis]|uniref:YcxB family protein n=1 Tax=Anaeromicrobium sediminis TaxID=1478221 RepID=UPI0011407E68|nr:YcxB family protein [Anaeromicrobium sediminis]
MRAEVKLTLEDIINFNTNRGNRNIANRFLNITGKISLVVLPFALIGKYIMNYNISESMLLVLVSIPILKFVLTPLNVRWLSKRTMRKNKILRATQIYEFHEKGVKIKIDEMEAEMKWSQFQMIVESKEYFELYISSMQAYIIPKRCVDDPKELGELMKAKKKEKYYKM